MKESGTDSMTVAGRPMMLVTKETAILGCLPRRYADPCAAIDVLVRTWLALGVATALEHRHITFLGTCGRQPTEIARPGLQKRKKDKENKWWNGTISSMLLTRKG